MEAHVLKVSKLMSSININMSIDINSEHHQHKYAHASQPMEEAGDMAVVRPFLEDDAGKKFSWNPKTPATQKNFDRVLAMCPKDGQAYVLLTHA